MAWTAPRSWVAGETVTAALMNTHVRDNEKALSDPWGAYTPTWTGNTTNPSIGNGTLTGNFLQVGKWVRFRIDLVFGTTTNAGSGNWFWTLPTAAVVGLPPVGTAVCYNGTTTYPRLAHGISTTAIIVADMVPNRAGGTIPFTWASTHELHINGEYEAA